MIEGFVITPTHTLVYAINSEIAAAIREFILASSALPNGLVGVNKVFFFFLLFKVRLSQISRILWVTAWQATQLKSVGLNKLLITNLPGSCCRTEELQQLISANTGGDFSNLRVHPESMEATVVFTLGADAFEVMQKLQGRILDGKQLMVFFLL